MKAVSMVTVMLQCRGLPLAKDEDKDKERKSEGGSRMVVDCNFATFGSLGEVGQKCPLGLCRQPCICTLLPPYAYAVT